MAAIHLLHLGERLGYVTCETARLGFPAVHLLRHFAALEQCHSIIRHP